MDNTDSLQHDMTSLRPNIKLFQTYTTGAVNFYARCHFFDISVKYGWIVDVNGGRTHVKK